MANPYTTYVCDQGHRTFETLDRSKPDLRNGGFFVPTFRPCATEGCGRQARLHRPPDEFVADGRYSINPDFGQRTPYVFSFEAGRGGRITPDR